MNYCPEIQRANGQGRTIDEARESLVDAIALILRYRREDSLRGVSPNAVRETVVVESIGTVFFVISADRAVS